MEVTSQEALKFIQEMQKRFPKPLVTDEDKKRLQEYLGGFDDDYIKAVGRRVQGDVMLRPPEHIQPENLQPKNVEPPDAKAVKPPASRRSPGAGRAPKRGDRGRR